jgi:hypothetical protein
MNHLKKSISLLIKNQAVFDNLFFKTNYETSTRLPLKLNYIKDYRDNCHSNFLLTSDKGAVSGSIGYASYKRMYFDPSFATMLEVGSKLGNSIPDYSINKMIMDIDNELLEFLALSITTGFKTIDNENFIFKNIVPEQDEKTSSDHYLYCKNIDIYDSNLETANVLNALNCTRFFSFIKKIIDPNTEHMKTIISLSESDFDFVNVPYFDLIMQMDKLNNIVELYIETFIKYKNMTINT